MGTRNVICVYYKGGFVIAQYAQWDGFPEGQGTKIWTFLSTPGNIARLKQGLEHIHTQWERAYIRCRQPVAEALQDWKSYNLIFLTQPANKEISEKPKRGEDAEWPLEYKSDGSPEVMKRFEVWKKHVLELNELHGLEWDDFDAWRRKSDLLMIGSLQEFWPSLSREMGAGILEAVASATAESPLLIKLSLEFVLDSLMCEWAYVVDLDSEQLEDFSSRCEGTEGLTSARFDEVEERPKGPDGRSRSVGMAPNLIKSFRFDELPSSEDEFVASCNRSMIRSDEEDEEDEEDGNEAEEAGKEDKSITGTALSDRPKPPTTTGVVEKPNKDAQAESKREIKGDGAGKGSPTSSVD
ncbi:hypothetical protein HYALB_00012813 [Hymenoscyphus albidus]|uniref:Uncharacterized protein n=1 Tax=Hymenoscyphus albidus TaxID=595503 RepID=A0A9N9Q077_9HELO|nr:hypothetical protein HYALB_00012813 [Hymenoscyphus albidus]